MLQATDQKVESHPNPIEAEALGIRHGAKMTWSLPCRNLHSHLSSFFLTLSPSFLFLMTHIHFSVECWKYVTLKLEYFIGVHN